MNAAKVRKDLSYLGSYGTRGVGYDVEYLLHEISRELGLTHDWPVAIVGVGNLGQALANYHGFGARGFRIVALFDADAEKVGNLVGDLKIEALDDLPVLARERGVAIGIIATPADAAQEVADRLVEAGVTSILNFAPIVVAAPPGVSLRQVDLAIELQILSFYQQRRQAAGLADGNGARRSRPMSGRAAIAGYPVNLVVASRRCVVVGAGRIAARKIAALLDAGADVHVIAPDATPEVRDWAEAGRLRLDDRKFEPADLDGAWLATTATGDPDVDHAVFAAAEDRHVWVNSADDPENCSFTLMSVVRSGDLVVTIGTGGRSPALASWLKARFEAELGPEYATLLDILSEAREELRASGRSSEDADWRQALDSGMLESIRAGRVDEAKETLRACLWS